MKAHHIFAIELPYVVTEYKGLAGLRIAISKIDTDRYLWIFPTKVIKDVVAILGRVPEFIDEEIEPLIPYCPALKERRPNPAEKKGKGYFKVIHRAPKIFVIETVINEKVIKKEIPTDSIENLWQIISKQPKFKAIKVKTVAENHIGSMRDKYDFDRFHRDTDTFSWEKFLGSRSVYFRHLYFPLKVLQADGVIEHNKSGLVTKTADEWKLQSRLS